GEVQLSFACRCLVGCTYFALQNEYALQIWLQFNDSLPSVDGGADDRQPMVRWPMGALSSLSGARFGLSRRGSRCAAHPFRTDPAVVLACVAFLPSAARASDQVEERFLKHIRPILEDYCAACHGNGIKKGSLSLDEVTSDRARLHDGQLWWAVLK